MPQKTIAFRAFEQDLDYVERLRSALQSRKAGAWLMHSQIIREALRIAVETMESR
jgi:hypothetical protein